MAEGGGEIEALDGLVSVLRSAERWHDLVAALVLRAEWAPAEQARADLFEVARIHAEKLAASDDAIAAWRRVRQRFGIGHDTFAPLADLLESASRWDDLARLVGDETKGLALEAGTPGVEDRLLGMKARGDTAAHRVQDRTLAASVYQSIFESGTACFVPPLSGDPSSDAAARWAEATWWALDELVRLAIGDRDYERAVRYMLDGARWVFDKGRSRPMRFQAAPTASDHLGDTS